MKYIYLYCRANENSIDTKDNLNKLLNKNGFVVENECSKNTELIISIGGDGTFLKAAKEGNYSIPVLGVNTGHLGFYADFNPNNLEEIITACSSNDFVVQNYRTLMAKIKTQKEEIIIGPAINDMFVKHGKHNIVHLNLYIENDFIENFSGDGLLVSSSAGSTAYNYSLGGGIVDPKIDLLQITPVAPVNNVIYRNFTSSLIIPPDKVINIIPKDTDDVIIVADGKENILNDVDKISIELSDKEIKVIRKSDYNFWSKVKSKFISY